MPITRVMTTVREYAADALYWNCPGSVWSAVHAYKLSDQEHAGLKNSSIGNRYHFLNEIESWVSENAPEENRKEAKKRIIYCWKENKENLDISNLKLTSIPSCIENLTQLTSLDVSKNRLRIVPHGIEKLANLKILNFRENHLNHLPSSLNNLEELRKLDLAENLFLSEVPQIPPKLTTLHVDERVRLSTQIENAFNRLGSEVLSNGLERWVNEANSYERPSRKEAKRKIIEFAQNRGQHELNLEKLALTTLPDCVVHLRHLYKLNLGGNALKLLPDGFEKLFFLDHLDLKGNRFDRIPESICRLPALETLDVSQNKLTSASLPEGLKDMNNLQKINLSNNRLTSSPLLRELFSKVDLDLSKNGLNLSIFSWLNKRHIRPPMNGPENPAQPTKSQRQSSIPDTAPSDALQALPSPENQQASSPLPQSSVPASGPTFGDRLGSFYAMLVSSVRLTQSKLPEKSSPPLQSSPKQPEGQPLTTVIDSLDATTVMEQDPKASPPFDDIFKSFLQKDSSAPHQEVLATTIEKNQDLSTTLQPAAASGFGQILVSQNPTTTERQTLFSLPHAPSKAPVSEMQSPLKPSDTASASFRAQKQLPSPPPANDSSEDTSAFNQLLATMMREISPLPSTPPPAQAPSKAPVSEMRSPLQPSDTASASFPKQKQLPSPPPANDSSEDTSAFDQLLATMMREISPLPSTTPPAQASSKAPVSEMQSPLQLPSDTASASFPKQKQLPSPPPANNDSSEDTSEDSIAFNQLLATMMREISPLPSTTPTA